MKANKETIISDILIELNGVNNQRGEVLAKVGKKWQLSDRTFDRLWKEANARHEISQLELQNKINEQSMADTKELLETSKITRETLLAELDQVKQISLTPDDNGRINTQAVIKAIEVQAKMLGLNEPDKVEAKITGIGASKVIISD